METQYSHQNGGEGGVLNLRNALATIELGSFKFVEIRLTSGNWPIKITGLVSIAEGELGDEYIGELR